MIQNTNRQRTPDATGQWYPGKGKKKKKRNKMVERVPVTYEGEEGGERTGTIVITKGA